MSKFRELVSLEWVTDPEGRRCCRPRMTGKVQDKEGNVWYVCNVRATDQRGPYEHDHIVICAKNATDAARLLKAWWHKLHKIPDERLGPTINSHRRELDFYGSKGCWGNKMDDVTVERGLWVTWHHTDKHYEKVL